MAKELHAPHPDATGVALCGVKGTIADNNDGVSCKLCKKMLETVHAKELMEPHHPLCGASDLERTDWKSENVTCPMCIRLLNNEKIKTQIAKKQKAMWEKNKRVSERDRKVRIQHRMWHERVLQD